VPFPASGQAGEAGRAVRKAHSEKPKASRKISELIFSACPSAFLLPGSSLDTFQVTGANCLFSRPSRFADWLLCSFLPREESAYPPRPISAVD